MYTYLTSNNGPRTGANYLLEDQAENHIGRGVDCHIVLTDPLSSRVHAVIKRDDDQWWVRDADSRNGTFVNGQKVDEAQLIDGCAVRVGSAEFTFHQSAEAPGPSSTGEGLAGNLTQTIVRDAPIESGETSSYALASLQDPDQARDFLDLYQLAIKLLACRDPDEVVRLALDLLMQRTGASVVGFLWMNDDGQLLPKLVMPEHAENQVRLSDSLTKLVCRDSRAVWIANQSAGDDAHSLSHFADAICVPLLHQTNTLGAIHIYLEQGRFRQNDFDMAVSLANILVLGLTRARQEVILQANHARLMAKSAAFDELVGESKPMQDLKSKTQRVAQATGCVLIRGESGSGKELVARAIHRASQRADRPMLPVNCAAIPRDLMESQLFGHKKGAFTGAEQDHVGWFQQADSGTLFLDEVGEMTLEGQAKLLRILEGHPFLPVGASKEITVDVRVIAATNRDLRDFVRDRKFRDDLYYRLSVFELMLPPLRDRGEDIERLVDHFLDHFRIQHGRPQLSLTGDARAKLLGYNWPGNVRQLRNVIDSAVVMAEGESIEVGDLGLRDASAGDELASLNIDHWERKLIREALSRTGGNIPDAAKLLGIGRATLYRKVDEYNIER